ncbi:MAG: 50S ribosomal protein L11 methyltransferase [Planctomycetota bacterium]
MSADGGVRAFVLTGADREALLDWLHVHAEPLGVVEEDEALTVFLAAPPPPPPPFEAAMQERAIDPRALAATGLERDAAIAVADDLLVRPPWVPRPAGFAGIELVVPRGAAFGSGEHASTQAALRCLHALWNGPASCADVGTGSGILLYYCRARGAADLRGCDIEGPAVAAARELLPGARIELGGPELLAPADCVIANLTAAELHAALPELLRLWNGRGPLVLSGMRDHEVAAVRASVPVAPDRVEVRPPFTALGYAGGVAR